MRNNTKKIGGFIERLLPQLLTYITGNKREKVTDLKFNDGGIVYKLFRLWELVFWRKAGIRIEMSSETYEKDGKIIVNYKLYTWEATISHTLGLLQIYLKTKIQEIKTRIKFFIWRVDLVIPQLINIFNLAPQYQFIGVSRIPAAGKTPTGYLFAIGYDTALDLGLASTANLTNNFTCTGSNRLLINSPYMNLTDTYSGSTYNGVSMTSVGTPPTAASIKVHMYFLKNPASGTNSLVQTKTGTADNQFGCASSYSGAAQTGGVDSSNEGTNGGTSSFSLSTTVVVANSWAMITWRNGTTSSSGGTGTTVRITNAGTSNSCGIADSNGDLAAGSRSLVITSASAAYAGIIASFAPLTSTDYTQSLPETITLVDTARRSMTRQIVETVTLVATAITQMVFTKSLSDFITLVDTTRARISAKVLKEVITLVDTARVYVGTLRLTETVTLVDTISRVRSMFRSLTDTVTLTAALTKVVAFGKHLTESINLTARIRGLLNGVNMLYHNKYVAKVGSYFNKYIDPK